MEDNNNNNNNNNNNSGNSSNGDILITQWTPHYEDIFIDWCDNAKCYHYLHNNCHRFYHTKSIRFTIPVIFISTLTGVANFAQDRIPEAYQFYYTMGVGAFNILAGFITTVAQFLKINELNEGHRVSAISWAKLHRNIKIELTKDPLERENIGLFLKKTKEQYDLLVETSPQIPQWEILAFNKKFKNNPIFKPEICGTLTTVKDSVYKPDQKNDEDMQTVINIKERRKSIMHNMQIENFVKRFADEQNRQPSVEEIYENLKDEIDEIHINEYINSNNV
tara:strand:- start:3184 stop:4017 length:834 start_codon:yes stop_codon:yes gene_type:complete